MIELPWRVDIAGGWFDQPILHEHSPGAVLTLTIKHNDRLRRGGGLAGSTRESGMWAWPTLQKFDNREQVAGILYALENPPHRVGELHSGSQDAIGIAYDGLTVSTYDRGLWPVSICQPSFVEGIIHHLRLVWCGHRPHYFDPLARSRVTREGVVRYSRAVDDCISAFCSSPTYDIQRIGNTVSRAGELLRMMLPNVDAHYDPPEGVLGWKVCGAGGGGYVLAVVQNCQTDYGLKLQVHHRS